MANESKKPFNIKGNKLHIATTTNNQRKAANNNNTGLGRSNKRKYREFRDDYKNEQENIEIVKTDNKVPKLEQKSNSSVHNDNVRETNCSTKNEQIVALITYKTNELTREQQDAEKLALIITDHLSVPKLTRAKAKELNKSSIVSLPALTEQPSEQSEIISLINEELNSDEDDEEYTIHDEEERVSEDGTVFDYVDSFPNTPIQKGIAQNDTQQSQLSPIKFSADGCFKVPSERTCIDNSLIATRTRSKLCLEQTTIEDLQSSFIPPDVEDPSDCLDEFGLNDEEWMRFLDDFTKPLNYNIPGDDDDTINDPEYVVTEKEPIEPAEELRDVNIPKQELKDLVEELLESLNNEDISLDCINLDPANNILFNEACEDILTLDKHSVLSQNNNQNNEITFCSDVMSTSTEQEKPVSAVLNTNIMATVDNVTEAKFDEFDTITLVDTNALTDTNIKTATVPPTDSNAAVELIVVQMPNEPNCFKLAKVVKTFDVILPTTTTITTSSKQSSNLHSQPTFDKRYDVPYDNNHTKKYISVRRHIMNEYIKKFENLRYAQVNEISSIKTTNGTENSTDIVTMQPEATDENGKQNPLQQQYAFTSGYQYQLLQQQLRIHVQMLTQTFLQTHNHPDFWKLGERAHLMLRELKTKSTTNSNFNAWNLNGALKLIDEWRNELNVDNEENKELMRFTHKEMDTTTSNNRQIPKFHPRIMEKILNSNVFMYPQYLPRMPFTHRVKSYEVFAPAEAQLIAMGLETNLKYIKEKKEKVSHKSSALSLACKRLCGDIIWGKTHRRIWDHIKSLKNANYYNPIKYFFEHNYKAPTIDAMPIIGFENGKVLPPKDNVDQLPLVWKSYMEKKQTSTKRRQCKRKYLRKKRSISKNNVKTNFNKTSAEESIENHGNEAEEITVNNSSDIVEKLENSINQCVNVDQTQSKDLTVNANYLIDGLQHGNCAINNEVNNKPISVNLNVNNKNNDNCNESLPTNSPNNYKIKSLQSTLPHNNCNTTSTDCAIYESPLQENRNCESKQTDLLLRSKRKKKIRCCRLKIQKYRKSSLGTIHHKSRRLKFNKHYEKRYLKKFCQRLCKIYQSFLKKSYSLYEHSSIVQYCYRYFKALELYTNFLKDLKMFCRQNSTINSANGTNSTKRRERLKEEDDCTSNKCGGVGIVNGTQRSMRKNNRQEENIRHMLLPDNAEEVNRKDALFAFNFYEKVEEAFKASNQPENYIKFNNILKSFNPTHDKVSDLYFKMESLFLPHHSELAEIFLTFLLPSEAVEIGKFFEHFIITNMTTFINKLNIYFNKQPAQIRKIYACLSELAEDTKVTMKKIQSKILPLLKGNQFLIDWFMQQFPESVPPERLFSNPEHIHLKECQNKISTCDHVETVNDLLDSPIGEQTAAIVQQQQSSHLPPQQSCQLKYINGRIFYGSKVLLPAKLSFIANDYCQRQQKQQLKDAQLQDPEEANTSKLQAEKQKRKTNLGCCHKAIREYGEKRLQSCSLSQAESSLGQTTAIGPHNTNEEINDKSAENETNRSLIINTAVSGEEENVQQTAFECCDDNTLRAHAMRLNPTYYGSTCLSANWEKCPSNTTTTTTTVQQYTNNNKKGHDIDGKILPRKLGQQQTQQHSPQINNNNSSHTNNNNVINGVGSSNSCGVTHNCVSTTSPAPLKEKRKSYYKKIRFANSTQQSARNSKSSVPMVIIHNSNTSSAIGCAKRLKTLIDEEENQSIDTKERLNIIARTKRSINSDIEVATSLPSPLLVTTNTSHSKASEIKAKDSNNCVFLSENSSLVQKPDAMSLLQLDLNSVEKENSSMNNFGTNHERKVINNTPIRLIDSNDDNNKLTLVPSPFNDMNNAIVDNIRRHSKTIEICGEFVESQPSIETTGKVVATVEGSDKTATMQTKFKKDEECLIQPWTRDEDKIILLEMKLDTENECQDLLYERLVKKLTNRSLDAIKERYQFLIGFLAKLQGK